MRELTIFQVGDVHYPDHTKPFADIRDGALSAALVAAATPETELQGSTRALLARLESTAHPILVFMGDLTTKGDLAQYDSCVEFLERAFSLSDAATWQEERLHVVPGNHDVDRSLAAPGDLLSKFVPLADAWHGHGLGVIATKSIRHTTFEHDDCRLDIYGLNSCLGAGEVRSIPSKMAGQLVTTLAGELGLDASGTSQVEAVLAASHEDLDVPAYSEDDVTEFCTSVTGLPNGLAVLVAHHNLLEQAQTRIDTYTNLLNAGMTRSRVSALLRPVLYLHGHIHDDPIEVVTQHSPDVGQVICVSAPKFSDGFNEISVVFDDLGTPLGCEINRVRVRLNGAAATDNAVRVRFARRNVVLSDAAMALAKLLLAKPKISSLDDVIARCTVSSGLKDKDLAAKAVLEAEWYGYVDVLDREHPPDEWRLRAVAHD